MAETKDRVMKSCPHCSALFDARAWTNHTRACKEKQENINKNNTELETSQEKKNTPSEQLKTPQSPLKKFKAILIIPLILILILTKLILSTTSPKKQKETEQNQQEKIHQKRYLTRR